MKLLKSTFGSFQVYHRTQKEFDDLLRDIDESRYQLSASHSAPVIIDAGAHIGMVTLYLKWSFPDAHILCFEPSPEAFELLKRNIAVNQLTHVTAIQAALSNQEGQTTLYGRMGWQESDTRGNSIIPAWGAWQSPQSCLVKTVKLSSYITQPVDFLKLDVEGAEMMVLADIKDKLSMIKNLFIEAHTTKQSNFNSSDIKSFLMQKDFHIDFETSHILADYLPEDIKEKANNLNATLTLFKATNKLVHELQIFRNNVENTTHESLYK